MRIYPVKQNPIGSAVSEILRYRQTDRQTHILLLYYKYYICSGRQRTISESSVSEDSNGGATNGEIPSLKVISAGLEPVLLYYPHKCPRKAVYNTMLL